MLAPRICIVYLKRLTAGRPEVYTDVHFWTRVFAAQNIAADITSGIHALLKLDIGFRTDESVRYCVQVSPFISLDHRLRR